MKVTKHTQHTHSLRLAAISALTAFSLAIPALNAADHGDSPVASNNQSADIADVYAFIDPNTPDNVILIATVRGFIAAGENSNFGIFDPNIRYRFDIETTGDAKADKFIDVTFTPRTANPINAGEEVLQVPKAQTATVAFSGFKDATGKKLKAVTGVETTASSTSSAANAQVKVDIGNGITFFAGLVDDPFFFDIPAFSAFIKSVREGNADLTVFNRARDSFAGYNVMSIALSIPATMLRGSASTSIGVAFETQRKIVQNPNRKTGAIKGTGVFHTIDRMANPAVNVVLIPFNRKDEYNQGTPLEDSKGRFAGGIAGKPLGIVDTLKALHTDDAHIGILASVAVEKGDFLRLETDKAVKPNGGTGGGGPVLSTDPYGNGFPNGRRLRDDVVDILLSLVLNDDPAFLTGTLPFPHCDSVNASDPLPQDTFPFLALPNQPFPNGTLDDKTRN